MSFASKAVAKMIEPMTIAAIQKTALLFLRGGATDMVQIYSYSGGNLLNCNGLAFCSRSIATEYAFMND
ncbi:hypothetical protein [Rhizobium leucaenae]|uniref:Uncharacterized protein n=1 Tax=Rhizobium leucaenae TaxID=29450 RepID=A0A7W6ZQ13_9HYPH|nr:hypothetical protein [Rhizobium leucaenae]MBB4566633.1 hypothetical protein [Rhizobium leucaenae]MBB6301471.1 hypothetical protein [Rhizobium leucaenae]